MIPRRQSAKVVARLEDTSTVVLLGARQVGKTTLARGIADERGPRALYLDLERAADRRRLDDADHFLRAQAGKLVVIDEIHRAPGLFEVLRGVIDDRRREGDRTGHFLLLGSATLDLMRQASESLAGRAAYVELPPIDAAEIDATSYGVETLWVRGGFPESLLARSDTSSLSWRRDFIRSYLERDVPMFAPRLPSESIDRLWRMLAHEQGAMLNQSRLAASLGVSAPTVARYVDLLVDMLLVRRLRPWSGNVGKRLVRTPKLFVRDSGLVHALLDLESWNDVVGHPVAGASWEGLVIETLVAVAGERYTPLFYRTEDGAEVDLVLERGADVAVAVEIKRSTAPKLSRGFRLGCEALRPAAAFVVHAGTDRWPMPGGAEAIPLQALASQLASAQ